ncbi:MAG TPA: RagB/SusD family nutrient uptake outer membrane protein [Bacteroidota bacterium]|nr:RagB/SusD family nutrient uptake outer membrane protein [Bacteroidota bacterium]
MKKYILLLVMGSLVVGLFSGCDSDLAGINQSPNAISDKNLNRPEAARALIVNLQVSTGDWYPDERSRITSVWTRHMCAPPGLGRPQPVSWNTYKMVRDEHVDRAWIQAYRVVKLANDIIANVPNISFPGTATIDGTRMTRLTRNTMIGMAKFYKALALGETAAFYGSIPVDVAKRAEDPPPQFVSQSAAYAYVQTLLDEALVLFQDSTVTITQDLNFGTPTLTVSPTHRDRWIRATRSLKARFYLHVGNYAAARTEAQNGINAATGTVNAIFNAGLSTEYAPWGHWSQTEAGEPLRAAKFYVDQLRSEAGDTRLAAYLQPGAGTTTIAGYNVDGQAGATTDENTTTRAARLLKYRGYGQPFPLISYEETLLIRAEAEARVNGVTAAALADLNAIRTAAGLPARTVLDFASTAAFITEVLKQKYIQLHLEGQAYHDMRRASEFSLSVLPTGSSIPVRWIYGQSEQFTNPNCPRNDVGTVRNEVL